MEKLNTIQKRNNLNTVYRDGSPDLVAHIMIMWCRSAAVCRRVMETVSVFVSSAGPVRTLRRGRASVMRTCWKLYVTSCVLFRLGRSAAGKMPAP